ncbi:VanW family protein [Nocardia australiensis]|uniref:VanW family protein n=1 Tax=Nocardia australiensis TaxID=2887191 RepID=UPI001D14450A|nr:VanW family protein [Nocardia australiensis]
MTRESNTGRGGRGHRQGGEGGLRQFLDAARSPEPNTPAPPRGAAATPDDTGADNATALTQPLRATARPRPLERPGDATAATDRRSQRPGNAQPPNPVTRKPVLAKRIGIGLGAVVATAGLFYVADLLLSSGEVPRGVEVAGVDIGGLDTSTADARLRAVLGPRSGQELPVRIGDMQTTLIPDAAGLEVDWDTTWTRVGSQPLNPFTRLTSLFTTHVVPVATAVDDAALDRQLTALRTHDRPTVEGTVSFQGVEPVAVPPVLGRVLDGPAARSALIDNWALGAPVDLPETAAPMTVRPEAVDQALRDIAEPAVRAPIVFAGKGVDATLQPDQIASILSFTPDGKGGLAATFNQEAATGLLGPQLATSEVEPKDATFDLVGSTPKVVPAIVGDKINWGKTLEQLPNLIVAPQQRTAQAIYDPVEPKLTTEAAQGLGVTEVMGQFSTNGFSGPSGVNIRVVARKVNGAVIKPGDTFSLNDFTGPRGTAEGYVESGIIDHGRPSTAVGGGISQFATTLYNAAYFAGLEDGGHTEHSYYISRYPEAREATVFDGAIDLSFRNNTPTGIYIETAATDSEITVRLWGTKTVNVESVTGERTKPTEPNTVELPKGKDCIAAEGAPGFTSSDTRVITDRKTGREVSRHTRTVKYDPVPIVKCE